MYIDFKFSQWERIIIPDDLKDKFIEWLKENPNPSANEVELFCEENEDFFNSDQKREELYDTYEELSVIDNGGCDTTELFNDEHNMIWNNVTQFNQA